MTRTTRRSGWGVFWVLLPLAAGSAGASIFNVDRFDDSTANSCTVFNTDDCGLRGAIIRAHANPGDDVIRLDSGTYSLSIAGTNEDSCQTGDLDVTDTVLIVGAGPDRTVIDAAGVDRVFDVHATGKRLTLEGVTVTGGAFHTGGGISVSAGSLDFIGSVASGNESANGSGSAIFASSTGSTDHVLLEDSWVTGNSGLGEAIFARVLFLNRSTVSGNSSLATAAAVHVTGPGSQLSNSTISGHADIGLQIDAISVSIDHCTLANNAVSDLYLFGSAAASLSNTLIVGNCIGTPASDGGNMESPGHTCGFGAADLDDVADPGLSPLGFFGGPAPAHRLRTGSPAIDAAIASVSCAALDQRGLSRPRDGDGDGDAVCDVGALELAGPGEIFVETFECGFTTPWSDAVP